MKINIQVLRTVLRHRHVVALLSSVTVSLPERRAARHEPEKPRAFSLWPLHRRRGGRERLQSKLGRVVAFQCPFRPAESVSIWQDTSSALFP